MTDASTSPADSPESTEPRLQLTEKAAQYMKTKLEFQGKPGAALRIGVKGGGCNGLKYVTEVTEAPRVNATSSTTSSASRCSSTTAASDSSRAASSTTKTP